MECDQLGRMGSVSLSQPDLRPYPNSVRKGNVHQGWGIQLMCLLLGIPKRILSAEEAAFQDIRFLGSCFARSRPTQPKVSQLHHHRSNDAVYLGLATDGIFNADRSHCALHITDSASGDMESFDRIRPAYYCYGAFREQTASKVLVRETFSSPAICCNCENTHVARD